MYNIYIYIYIYYNNIYNIICNIKYKIYNIYNI